MKKISILFSLLFAMVFSVFAAGVPGIIGIKADRSTASFPLTQVQTITVVDNNGVSLQVNDKDGKSTAGFQTIVFADEVTGAKTPISDANVSVYPTPVEKIIYVTGLESDADLQIADMSGKIIKSAKSQQIDVETLPTGTYILSVNGKIVKFIKK